jgi:hypothetical protein
MWRAVALTDIPIACTLSSSELARRQAELRTGVLAAAVAVEPLPSGLRWRFAASPEIVTRLASLVEAERQCCGYLRFRLDAEPGLAGVTLEVTGPEGTRDFLGTWVATADR